jgi:hypothetical protein
MGERKTYNVVLHVKGDTQHHLVQSRTAREAVNVALHRNDKLKHKYKVGVTMIGPYYAHVLEVVAGEGGFSYCPAGEERKFALRAKS